MSGVLTGLAALLTVVGGLVIGLHLVDSLPSPLQETPNPQVEGVGVKIVAVRQSHDRGATFVTLYYSVTTGADFSRHDPSRFVQLVSGGVARPPLWVSAPARDLSPNSQQDFSVRFSLPAAEASIVFRFGEEHYLDLPAQVAN